MEGLVQLNGSIPESDFGHLCLMTVVALMVCGALFVPLLMI